MITSTDENDKVLHEGRGLFHVGGHVAGELTRMPDA